MAATNNHETGIWLRAFELARDFFHKLGRLDNKARVLVLLLLSLALILPPIIWWIFERSGEAMVGPNNSHGFAVLSAIISLLGALLAAAVLIRLEGIKSTEEFLYTLIDMLGDAQAGNEFVFVAPTFNIQSIPHPSLYDRYRSAFARAVQKKVNISVSYYNNELPVSAFVSKGNDANEKNILLNAHKDCQFLAFHLQALDNPHQALDEKVKYFTRCFGFLAQLRSAGTLSECVYQKPTTSAANVHPFFIGNLTSGDFFLGQFTVNPTAPQAVRVDCDGEFIRSRNKFTANALSDLVKTFKGNTVQSNSTEAEKVPPTS